MADEMDRVQTVNEDFQAFARKLHERGREPGEYTGKNCIDCGEEIPEKRRQALPGCRRCVTCQEEFELLSHWRA